MKKDKNSTSYTAAELKTRRAENRSDLNKIDAMTDEKLERLIAEDEDERGLRPDWTRAKLILPQAKQSIHLRLEQVSLKTSNCLKDRSIPILLT